jgi:flagellar P-ring protein precursor FlgI
MILTVAALLAAPLYFQGQGNLRVVTTGIEAPEQPSRNSSATYTLGERFTPKPGRGPSGKIHTPVGTLMQVRGQEDNELVGIGLVTGLAGTGDSVNMIRNMVQNLLLANNIKIDPQQLTSKNVALVTVEATLPAGIHPGRRIDCRVATIGDCKSLQGGVLTLMELTDMTGAIVYGTASGPIDVGGFMASGEGASVTQNHVTVGIIPGGGKVERAVPANIVSDHGWLYLDARAPHGSFANMARIVESINALYPNASEAVPFSRTVKVRVPEDLPESAYVAYVDSLLSREIEPSSIPKVIVNERTGMIVMAEGVRLRPGAVAHGDLTVTIAETPETSQPGALSGGTTQTLPRTDIEVNEENNGLTVVPGAVELQEVVEVLNVLGTTPRDLIAILEAMSQAGLVLAEIERM